MTRLSAITVGRTNPLRGIETDRSKRQVRAPDYPVGRTNPLRGIETTRLNHDFAGWNRSVGRTNPLRGIETRIAERVKVRTTRL